MQFTSFIVLKRQDECLVLSTAEDAQHTYDQWREEGCSFSVWVWNDPIHGNDIEFYDEDQRAYNFSHADLHAFDWEDGIRLGSQGNLAIYDTWDAEAPFKTHESAPIATVMDECFDTRGDVLTPGQWEEARTSFGDLIAQVLMDSMTETVTEPLSMTEEEHAARILASFLGITVN